MTEESSDFGAKLDLALKVLNISRGALAAEARVDKSLVSRWARGLAEPRGHNLATLTAIVKARVADFNQLAWALPLDRFAAAIGAPPPQHPPSEASDPAPATQSLLPDGFLAVSRAQSAVEVAREGRAYPGIYVAFRQFFRNSGELLAELMIIWRDGDRLLFRQWDPSFSHGGEIFILRHQLFLVGEDDTRVDGLTYYLLNGVFGEKAIRFDGIAMTVLNDRNRTPTASPVVFQRLLDLVDGEVPPRERLAAIGARLTECINAGEIAAFAGPDIEAAIRPLIGAAGPTGSIDNVMRVPQERTLALSEVDQTEPVARRIDALRTRLLGPNDGSHLATSVKPITPRDPLLLGELKHSDQAVPPDRPVR